MTFTKLRAEESDRAKTLQLFGPVYVKCLVGTRNCIKMSTLTITELKEKLKSKNLPVNGTKNELLRRLLEAEALVEEELHMPGPSHELCEEPRDESRSEVVAQSAMPSLREIELLRKERDLAAREAELLRRELELLRMTPQSEASASAQTNVRKWKELENLVGEFSGHHLDLDRWERQVRNLLALYTLNEHQAKALVCSKLKGKALKWYHSRVDCIELSCEDLLRELKKMFGQRPDPFALRRELEARMWNAGETFADYLHDKVVLANRVPVSSTDELISYVIEGIPSQGLRTQAKVQRYETLEAMLNAFANVPSPKDAPRRQPIHPTTRKDKSSDKEQRKPKETDSRRCYNCNEDGHLAASCTKPKRERGSCFKCGKFGHKATQCKPPEDVNFMEQGRQEDDDFWRAVELRLSREDDNFKISLNALIDSGSPICFVKERYIPRKYIVNDPGQDRFYGLNGSGLEIIGYVKAELTLKCGKYNVTIRVVPDTTMQSPLVLGRDFMRIAKLLLRSEEDSINNEIIDIMNIEVDRDRFRVTSQEMRLNEDLPIEVKARARKLFEEHYVNAERPENPATENTLKLVLTNEKPFFCTPRRLSYHEKTVLRSILDELTSKGIIRESTSEYASPIVLTKKKNGETRMCVDFRTLNKITVRDNFPLPLIEDQLDLLAGKKYFTMLDLKDGFFHIRMHEDSVKYTSFVTPLGQYEYTKMPFGLKGAPLKFQRYVTQIFKDQINAGEILVYLDDFLIATETIEHHFYVLDKVFKLLAKNLLELRLDKCRFFQTKLDYLGYTVTSEGIRPTNQGIEAIKSFPTPRSVRDVQSFLGMCSYFRKFVEHFSVIAKPLYDMTKKDANFRFGEEEQRVFETLKNRLIEAPILSIYSPQDETELHCDASATGFGAILLQKKADRKLHPVFYFSKRTTEVESRYHSYELETLSIIYALRRFRTYLLGIKFKIITDCQALSLTLNKKETNPRIARWVLEMQNYDYVLEHRPGSRMLHVDALSRQIFVVEDNSFDRNLALCQSDDPVIAGIRKELEQSEHKLFEMRNGLVYRKYQGQILFYVPATLEASVMHKYHNEMSHVGLEKTVRNIMNSYWFPDMKTKVKNHIKGCLKCVAFTPNSGKPQGLLHNIPKSDVPFSTLHIDHLSPASRSGSSPCRHIFAVIDAFTKHVKLYATKTTNTAEVIKNLRTYFEYYSRPLRIISDRGSCFTSREFEDFMKDCNVQHVKIATASPQANGQVERLNRTILPMIAKLADERSTHWSNVLKDVEFTCNNVMSKATNESPSMLLFGVRQRGNITDELRDALEINGRLNVPRRELPRLRGRADEQIQKTQRTNQRIYDRRHKAANKYQVGDKVMVKNFDSTPGVPQKLIPRFKGPYQIDRVLRNDRYVLKDVEGFQLTQTPYQGTWEAANMRPWIPG